MSSTPSHPGCTCAHHTPSADRRTAARSWCRSEASSSSCICTAERAHKCMSRLSVDRNGARLTSTKVDSKEGLVLARTKKCRAGWSLMDSDVEASSVLVECRVLAVHRRDVLVQHLTTTPTFLRAIVSSSGLACARWSGTRKLNSLAWAAHLPWPLEAVRGQHGDGLASLVPQAV